MATFSPEAQAKLEALVPKYPTKMACTLPALWIAQEEFGYLTPEAMKHIADFLELPPSHVYSVASFYTMYHLEPTGKFLLEPCCSIGCYLVGGETMHQYILDKLAIGEGETTPDGVFTVRRAECLASCGTGPCLQVNGDRYVENITPASVDALLDELRQQAAQQAPEPAQS
jgi:NADH-quinone oxidoreductase subunit E